LTNFFYIIFICEGRKDQLLIGALKSNIGHTEASSGLCSLSKVIISLENQCIPANLHMKVPNPKIEGLVNGVLKPIIQNTPFDGDLVGLNCFGFGGVNVHAIVRANRKESSIQNYRIVDKIPRLVLMCGRNNETLSHTFASLVNNPQKLTRDYLSLLNDTSKTSPFRSNSAFKGMKYRGFTIFESSPHNKILSTNIEIKEVSKYKKQIWYIFSGMGSQWPAMAKSLIDIKSFAKSIKILAQVLKDYNIDLMNLLLETKVDAMQSPFNSFIAIAAIQIALVDLLNELDIRPDGVIGHSIGELVCAYADGCITAEETILIAYWRGKCLEDNNKTKGMMAAVGMSWDEIQQRCPENVFAACHNAEDSVTISGEENSIQSFVNKLIEDNIFARKVDSSGVAFHCPLINSIAEPLLIKLQNIIPSNRIRSSKWISSTYSQSECNSHKAKYASPQYFVDNLILPALFYDALKRIPKNAITIEISPHHLLQPILKRNLGSDITYIPLMKKNSNNMKLLLSSIGHLYTLGFNPLIEKLYHKVDYPVSSDTPLISPLLKWNHKKKYTVTQYPDFFNPIGRYDYAVKVDLQVIYL
jgi:fatty acid synthase